jgi:hypothetical protein
MNIVEARAFLKAHAKQAVETYRYWTTLGFDFQGPVDLAAHLSSEILVRPPVDDPWDIPF